MISLWNSRVLYRVILLFAASVLSVAAPVPVSAQSAPPAAVYSQEQLDQMLAPVALYPDALLAQILMASTYPLEVVEANRWLQDPANAALKGDQLAAALEEQPWDPSVKSLVPFPQIVQMMDANLQWTEQLGDAFLANQAAAMDSVQRLRQEAEAAGKLQSTQQQAVTTQDAEIQIAPANPDMVYVPYYNPTIVYGAWPYPGYPPYYFAPPYGVAYDDFIGFGIGIAIIAPFWGWDHWDWHNHHIDIDDNRFRRINHGQPPVSSGVWRHDPAHRGGVPYHSAAVRTQFQRTSDASRRSYRGYSPASPLHPTAATHAPEVSSPTARSVHPSAAIAQHNEAMAPHVESHSVQPRANVAAAPTHQAAPMFESFSHGADVRAQAARGSGSRQAATPRSAPARAAPAPKDGGHSDEHK